MDKPYWLNRWAQQQTGWHQTEAEPHLVHHFSDLKPTRVFVPLCGKSLDLVWLASRGHEVVGVEFSEDAGRGFFVENQIPHQESTTRTFKRIQGGGVTILVGDYFELTPQDLGPLGAVYDRAALIALPEETRARYATQMVRLLGPSLAQDSFRFLQIVLERTPHDDQGPPHSVQTQELAALYASTFEVAPQTREPIDMGDPAQAKTEECVYTLQRMRD